MFAKRIFESWSFLRPHLSNFNNLYKDYQLYCSQIPSYGAIIFNKDLEQILFVMYDHRNENVASKLDFPKGKVD